MLWLQAHITALPKDVLATPFGQMLAPMLSQTIGDRLGHVHQEEGAAPMSSSSQNGNSQPTSTDRPTAGHASSSEVDRVADAIKDAAAVAAADTGIPVDAPAQHLSTVSISVFKPPL